MAEEILERGEKLYCLGQIVHNEKEVKRLEDKGLQFIELEDLNNLSDTQVLIRAHGEPPSTYELCRKNNISIIDGTCPIVNKLQKNIKKAWDEMDSAKDRIIIYGKPEHPEVIGLNGQTGNQCLVVSRTDQLPVNIEVRNLYLFSQTTMDSDGFAEVEEGITSLIGKDPEKNLISKNTICRHISHRQPGITEFAHENELIIFVAGKHSSNGKILYEICKKENPNCRFISEVEELKPEWIKGIDNIGITGATSTPEWLLREVEKKILAFTKE